MINDLRTTVLSTLPVLRDMFVSLSAFEVSPVRFGLCCGGGCDPMIQPGFCYFGACAATGDLHYL